MITEDKVLRTEAVTTYDMAADEVVETPRDTWITVRPCHLQGETDEDLGPLGVIAEIQLGDRLFYHTFSIEEINRVVDYVADFPNGTF